MSTADQNHIPPELLEEAACGHLAPERHAAVEAHCAVCPQCRAAYDMELRIARGTRSWARAALKARIAARVGSPRSTPIPWTQIVAAAAVVLVIAGTGIVYQWLRVSPEPSATTVISAGSADSLIAPDAAPVARELADARTKETAPPPITLKGAVAEEQSAGQAKRESETFALAPAAAPDARDEAPTPVPETPQAADPLPKNAASEFIVWGNIIGADETKDKAVRTLEIFAGEAAVETRGAQMQGARKTGTQISTRFTVDQEVILGMYRRDADSRPGQIPARVSRAGDTVRIVLLLDSLLPDDVIRAATVLTFPPDSLQIRVPGKVIGIRTPTGFLP